PEILVRCGDRGLGIEHDFMRETVEVEERIVNCGIGVPKWNARSQASLAVSALEALAVDVLAPIAQLTEPERDDFEWRRVDGPIDFLPRDEPLALAGDRVACAVFFPRKAFELGGQDRI